MPARSRAGASRSDRSGPGRAPGPARDESTEAGGRTPTGTDTAGKDANGRKHERAGALSPPVFLFFVRLRNGGDRAGGLRAGFGSSGAPIGACSSARQASMPDSPPQAIHGLLSASDRKSTRLNSSH